MKTFYKYLAAILVWPTALYADVTRNNARYSGTVTVDTQVKVGHTSSSQTAKVGVVNSSQQGIELQRPFNGAGAPILTFQKTRNTTPYAHTIVQSSDEVGRLNFEASDGSAFLSAARLNVEIDGTPGTNDMPGRFVFLTSADGGASLTERMRIGNAGLISMSSSAPSQTQGQASRLYLQAVNSTTSKITLGNTTGGDGFSIHYDPSTGNTGMQTNGGDPTSSTVPFAILAGSRVAMGTNANNADRLRVVGEPLRSSRADTTPSGSAASTTDDLILGSTDTANTGMTIFGTGFTNINFGDAGSNLAGAISYDHSQDQFRIRAGDTADVVTIKNGETATTNILRVDKTSASAGADQIIYRESSWDGTDRSRVFFRAKGNEAVHNLITIPAGGTLDSGHAALIKVRAVQIGIGSSYCESIGWAHSTGSAAATTIPLAMTTPPTVGVCTGNVGVGTLSWSAGTAPTTLQFTKDVDTDAVILEVEITSRKTDVVNVAFP